MPAELASTLAAWSHDRGWRFLQAGDLSNAEQEFGLALRTPDFYPSLAGRGYVELQRKYRVSGTQDVRTQTLLLGFRMGPSGWILVELRVGG